MAKNHEEGVLLILTGLPASGKTTVAKRLGERIEDLAIISSDDLRRQGKPSELWDRMRAVAREELERGRTVVADATNYTQAHRKRFISAAEDLGCPYLLVYFEAGVKTLLERNLLREEKIPSAAIRRLAKLFEEPEIESTIVIDTEELNPEEAAQVLEDRIRSMRNEC